jgi:hypothetical protein
VAVTDSCSGVMENISFDEFGSDTYTPEKEITG